MEKYPDENPARDEMPEFPIEIGLRVPLVHGDDEIAKIVIKRPLKVKDLRGVKIANLAFDDFALIIGRLANLPASVIEQMDLADFASVMEVVSGFLGDFPGIGSRE